jgi:hypothetical protein
VDSGELLNVTGPNKRKIFFSKMLFFGDLFGQSGAFFS